MRPNKARYITACQQILVLGVVVAVLAPAANVVSLDVIRPTPIESSAAFALPSVAEEDPAAAAEPTVVEAAPVETVLTEHAMAAPPAAVARERERRNARRATPPAEAYTAPEDEEAPHEDEEAPHEDEAHDHTIEGEVVALSEPQPVEGYGVVGVTWDSADIYANGEIGIEIRTRTGEAWSEWTVLDYQAEEGPHPDSEEGRDVRPGTAPMVVGDVDAVQARTVTASGETPTDLRLAVILPGDSEETETLEPGVAESAATAVEGEEGDIALQAAARPTILTRAQWGAPSSPNPTIARVNGAVIHHTVTANDYPKSQVAGMIRSIHTFHTRSRGWSDIGYNFLVDRFGRIWEGRAGGVERAVQGAHASGYNHLTFGVSALGNYDVREPTSDMLEGLAQIIAWKLSHHGVTANATWSTSGRSFNTVIGHRDVGSTACPGRYLYNKFGSIRTRARALQQAGGGSTPPPTTPPPAPPRPTITPAPKANLVGTPFPDMLMRRRSDGRIVVLPTEGLINYRRDTPFGPAFRKFDVIVATPDITGDRRPDLLVRNKKTGVVMVRPGRSDGKFGKAVRKFPAKRFAPFEMFTAVGDLARNGHNDFVARHRGNKSLHLFRGNAKGGFKRVKLGNGFGPLTAMVGTGDVTGDGLPDLVARDRQGRLWAYPGIGGSKLGARRQIPGDYSQWNAITGFGDFNGDGRADLLVRQRSTGKGYILPSNGAGGFGHPHGPINGVQKLRHLSGAGALPGGAGPDIVGRAPNGKLVVVRHVGRHDTGRMVETNLGMEGVDLVLNAGDWTGNGIGDVIVRRSGNGSLRLRPGLGNGQYGPAVVIGSSNYSGLTLMALGDVTGDGKPDLVARGADGQMRIYTGAGTGPLTGPTLAQPIPALRGFDPAPYDWMVWTEDLQLSGRPGLLVRERTTGRIFAIQNDGTGAALPRRFLVEGLAGYDLYG